MKEETILVARQKNKHFYRSRQIKKVDRVNQLRKYNTVKVIRSPIFRRSSHEMAV
jgi:hypothetical protein